ncbi:MAG TPA: hypothetical protein DCZ92_08875 [Elusimicrobia bacterium]|nr:MAG: hypothetical protein A2016_01650 [Elusimicrobia bacterium GWF2_62_30]HBA60918.1 hypothetical protein [Elusimicrobiota bacterium]
MQHCDNDGILVSVGRKIVGLRKQFHMTQADLARKLHAKIEDVDRMEKGLYKLKLGTLLKIARVFGKRLEIKVMRGKRRV